ncbi:MAG: precorrin-3B C(17)-methyltransferase [Okeania sp. SIO2C2]|uniref:precorrin-3B C(17)-methyltransferase n=1 Tax=Okeania sp. SIO2C2 TaxID=2607787 RepID=UPI0013BBAA78|nr:precorrin-3B C(17)-methyltransferase [Okeania sp. SIO2C2]NEP87398.1 precorrin-3B C(17)-methyltransferase [Okeania sp. SIO2C2]
MNLIGQEFQPIAAIATTPTATKLLQPICQTMGATLWIPESCQQAINSTVNAEIYTDSLKNHLANIWQNYSAIVFCLASGAVVRLISPLLKDKYCDPAVVVVDEAGQFVISLCSGHQGGADKLTNVLARLLNAIPVITGASHNLGLPGIDILGKPFGWQQGEGDWNRVSGIVARGETVQVIQEVGSTLWQEHLPQNHPFYFGFPEIGDRSAPTPKARIWISFTKRQFSPDSDLPKVQWHPRVLWIGVGCERGTSKKLIATAIQQVFQTNHLAKGAIAGIATIDLKADEIGLVEFCQEQNLPLQTFPSELLSCVEVPTPSKIVAQEVGTPSVAEAAAILGAREVKSQKSKVRRKKEERRSKKEEVRSKKEEVRSKKWMRNQTPTNYKYCVDDGILNLKEKDNLNLESKENTDNLSSTFQGINESNLLVSKQIFRLEGEPGAATIAVAVSKKEYTGRTGKLLLIGTGPGKLEQMTPAAQMAVSYADVVIGYSLYIDLIQPLLNPGQIIEKLPITQEKERAERAIELANFGLNVAVVSSGDCGIYGMAGLVLEQLRATGWDGKIPIVEVFPGVSALQSAAARVGAPLMHDFCAISLSDLLTPWEVIEKRLNAVAMADFVVALYNPKSQKRTEQLVKAVKIFLEYRKPETPVAIVRSVYRENEEITLTSLDKLLEFSIDMLTVILIGNESTGIYNNWMITPRGYLG